MTPGVRLGPYEVLSILGAGGMAEVYRARDTRLGRDIALKVVNEALNGDPDLVRRFEQEARIAGSLNHPNLVAVYDFGLHEGAPYFVTELLQGESLRPRLSRCRLERSDREMEAIRRLHTVSNRERGKRQQRQCGDHRIPGSPANGS